MLVVGAGGAGLRAVIEAADAGVSVGVICKSLLGKAHTVMAEGGMAAALGNVDDRDNWKVHFADTMRGGQYVNNWRMAELHAKEAPDRVRELERYGAVFDRTPDGRILQRNFGGHRYPRLAHVGDRTGLELIRTLQDHTIHKGATVLMEHTVVSLLLDDGRVAGVVAYDRERGRFHVIQCKALILACGGLGRAFSITSNSWEGTGDGHALAYAAGAELIDMEFVQFHPTGMVWPPSVKGILVTEGVRGEGGILTNSEGRRFMFDDIPDNYKPQTATDPEEGWRYTQGDKSARRPPELLTRDHVARCINREVKAGRGSPHGGVFLDIAWIKEKLPERGRAHPQEAAEHVPPVQGAGRHRHHHDADGGRADHALRDGRHPRRRRLADVDDSRPVRRRRVRRRHQRRQPPRRQLAVGSRSSSASAPASTRPSTPATARAARVDDGAVERAIGDVLAPFDRPTGENPFVVQHDLQEMMQDLVGIVRREDEMQQALVKLEALKARAARVGVAGHREYNTGWHTAIDLRNLLIVSEAITRAAIERKESRGGHFREDFPDKDKTFGSLQHRAEEDRRRHAGRARADPRAAGRAEAGHRGDGELMAAATFRIWRGEGNPAGDGKSAPPTGSFTDYRTEVSEGMVVLDAVHQIQAESASDLACRWNCKAGKCGSCSAEINGNPRLMCMTRLNTLDLTQPVTVEPMRAFPLIRDLVTDVSWNFRVKQKIKPFKPRQPDAPDGTWRMQQSDIDRVQKFRKCIECFLCQDVCHVLRDHQQARRVRRPALPDLRRRARDAPARHRRSHPRGQGRDGLGLLQHHQVLHQGVPRAHHDHRRRHHPAQGAGRRRVLRSGDAAAEDVPGLSADCDSESTARTPEPAGGCHVRSEAALEERDPGGAGQGRALSAAQRADAGGEHLRGRPARRAGQRARRASR